LSILSLGNDIEFTGPCLVVCDTSYLNYASMACLLRSRIPGMASK